MEESGEQNSHCTLKREGNREKETERMKQRERERERGEIWPVTRYSGREN